jgi:ATP-dependent Clp protease ATP-binding subunit ClpA
MTSNIGSRLIASSGSRGAFLRSAREQQVDSPEVSADAEAMSSPEAWTLEAHRQSAPRRVEDEEEEVAKSYGRGRLRELVLDEIKQFFRPELLNR